MQYLTCDYMNGAHPEILKRMTEENFQARSGYGEDEVCRRAKEKIREACGDPSADIYFLVGGTQTNSTVIAAMLESYEGVVAAETGHIAQHESGAVEYTGHKVLTLPQHYGKIDAGELAAYMENFYGDANHEHMVFPGMVYISHPTEYGTLYTKTELTAIADICRQYDMPLFLDGARLGYGLMSFDTDLTLRDITALCDVFYIGGTKVGALFGEAVVFPRHGAPKHFMTIVKQHGALLAKGWLLGLQFDTLFTDDLYFRISRHAIEEAEKVKAWVRKNGYRFWLETPTNQQFIIVDPEEKARLSEQVTFDFWEQCGEETVVRLATAWYTEFSDM
ncbi:MAG: aminotransferase class I/II-fold pyridoxal phosphate-dependent enzyme [Clostridia bacterium]|nr:aminotransferase class I/II-fold pyridoxal phosphate-dependent enzyme [Clostridia bacterium]